jgi:hypothetical protein
MTMATERERWVTSGLAWLAIIALGLGAASLATGHAFVGTVVVVLAAISLAAILW